MKIFEDLKSDLDNVVNSGLNSLGFGPKRGSGGSGAMTTLAQFPAERSAATDSVSSVAVNNLYQNGIMFSAFNYSSRTSTSLKDFRLKNGGSILSKGLGMLGLGQQGIAKNSIATILMPKSQTDVEIINHKFNSVEDSLMTRGGGTVSGAISSMASHALFGAIESVANGYMADKGEQIQAASRSMYGGPENRVKNFAWTLVPRTVYDLIEIIKIYEIFAYLSYGKTGQTSSHAKELKNSLDSWYKETLLNPMTPEGSGGGSTMFEGITDFLSNVLVVSNPTIWMISNFGSSNALEARSAAFGPAQIQSIRFDKAPNGHFGGLAIAPNLPNAFVLEVSFIEIIALNRDVLFSGNSIGDL